MGQFMRIKNVLWAFIILPAVLLIVYIERLNAAPPTDFTTTQVVSGLNSPTSFAFAPDGRIFITELGGNVKIYKNGQLLPVPFTTLQVTSQGDRGLLNVAIDPDFENGSPYAYFYYTGVDKFNRIAKVNASQDAAAGQPQIIYQSYSPSEWLHVGGSIAFGPDRKLYLAIGDNGYPPNAQDLSFANHFGKVLRLNKDGSIPVDNPFYGQSTHAPEIWAWGFRNPFRMQFDTLTGELYLGDVGYISWEEIDIVEMGNNYGWPICEASCTDPQYTNPIYEYPHYDPETGNNDSSVTLGPVYRGNAFPSSYLGRLFFGDYAKGFIKTLIFDQNGSVTGVENFDLNAGTVIDLKVAPNGTLYYMTIYPGSLYLVTYSQIGNQPPTAISTSDITSGAVPLTVNFDASQSTDPDGDPLTFDWDFGDASGSSEISPTHTFTNQGAYNVNLVVSDGINSSVSDPIYIQVGSQPNVVISAPTDGSTYQAGDTIFYSATGTDSNGIQLPDGNFTTEVIFHHGGHIHPFLSPFVSREGTFTIPNSSHESETNVWYEIKITGSDDNGLSSTQSINIYPEIVNVTLDTIPSGIDIKLNGSPISTPHNNDEVVGMRHEITAPPIAENGGVVYQFDGWSDGELISHVYTVPTSNSTITANYSPAPAFTAEFFDNMEVTGNPIVTRDDYVVDFFWGYGSPDVLIPVDNFSARWSKSQFFHEGLYTFTTTTDDGVRVFIDNNLIIDEWHDQSSVMHTKDIYLTQGMHSIKMEYFENGGVAGANLNWDLSINHRVGVIPDTQWLAEFWNTPDAGPAPTVPTTTPDLIMATPVINYDWVWGSPDPAITGDNFVARWEKSEVFKTDGAYKFDVTSDDGVRIYVDNNMVLDNWVDQSPTTNSIIQIMSAGIHDIVVEYYENTGTAVMEFSINKITSTPGGGDGIIADYFDNIDFTGNLITKTESNIHSNWGWGSPDVSIQNDTFSVRYSGKIEPEYSETYTFYTTTDDGVRLWIDNQLIIDQWIDQSASQWSGNVDLVGGQQYDIIMEYYENGGVASVKLEWESLSLAKEIVPQDRLYTSIQNTFTGEYWNNPGAGTSPAFPITPPNLTRSDLVVNFDWGYGSPSPVISGDHFIARWTKDENFQDGIYQFTATTDDGVRIYIDGGLILDNWIDQSPSTNSVNVPITAGTHQLIIEYYENSGTAVMQLSYVKT
jgi:glucose/arabinose dehydrogenase